MGFFKDLKKVTDQAKEMDRANPVANRLASTQAAMANANAVMSQMGQSLVASTSAMTAGVDALATISAARQTGAMMNYNPVVALDLLVMLNGVPVPVTHQCVVMQLHLMRAQPGQQVRVKVMADNPSDLWIDWVSPV